MQIEPSNDHLKALLISAFRATRELGGKTEGRIAFALIDRSGCFHPWLIARGILLKITFPNEDTLSG